MLLQDANKSKKIANETNERELANKISNIKEYIVTMAANGKYKLVVELTLR